MPNLKKKKKKKKKKKQKNKENEKRKENVSLWIVLCQGNVRCVRTSYNHFLEINGKHEK